MRLIPIRSCVPGMRLGKSIFNEEGVVLLNRHAELTQSLIGRLQHLGIDYVYIEDPLTDDIQAEDPISEETRRRALGELRTQFRSFMEQGSRPKLSRPVLGKTFGSVMKMIIDDLSEHQETMIMLMNMNVWSQYLYQHSLNVSIYSTMLGMASGYSRDELMTLGMGALLHDFGKTQIDLALLDKPGQLTAEEFAEIKRHPELGFKLLKDEPNIPLLAAHCAFQHHERLDGSGYPRGLKGDDIHEYAKWIAIADSYDAMTSHRPYRRAMLPHQAMEALFSGVGHWYELSKVTMFRDHVALYPLGLTVKLNTGERGVVASIDSRAPQRPIVRIVETADGEKLSSPYEIDLAEKLTVFIVEVDQ